MAGEDLYQSLGGVNFAPTETPWGIGATTLAQSTPLMISPYASTGQALGIGLGSVLLQSLLGYQAQKEAAQQSLTANTIANQMLQESDAQKRLNLIQSLEPGYYQPAMQRKLLNVQSLITSRDAANKAAAAQVAANELAKLKAEGEFQMSDLGQQMQQNKTKQAILAAGISAGRIPSEYADLFAPVATPTLDTSGLPPELAAAIKQLPPHEQQKALVDSLQKQAAQSGSEAAKQQRNAVVTVQDLEKTFRDLNMTAAEFKVRSTIPGDKAELAFSKLKGSLAALARVSGQTSQLSDVDLQQQMDAVLGPEIPGVGMISGTDSIADRLKQKLQTGNKLITQAPSGDEARREQLRKQIAEIKALLAQRQK